MKYLIFFSLFILVASNVFSQTIFQNFEGVGVDQGLSQSSVFAALQDRRGFLWIGTGDGLNRYDGNQIRIFKAPFTISDPSNSNLIRGNLVEDGQGNIWYSTENGLYKLERSTYTIKKKYNFSRKQLMGSDLKLCFIDRNQVLWLFSTCKGFSSYDTRNGKYQWTPHHLKIEVQQITGSLNYDPDLDGNIWFVVHKNDGIYKFNTRTLVFSHHFKNENLLFFKAVHGGNFRVGPDRIVYYDSVTKVSKVIHLPEGKKKTFIRSIALDNQDRIWIACNGSGLWMHDLKTNSTRNIHPKPDDVTTLLIDNKQNLWMGTDGSGMYKLNLGAPLFYSVQRKLLDQFDDDFFVKTIFEDAEKNIWFTTAKKQNYLYHPSLGKLVINPMLDHLKIKNVSAICKDANNRIWIAAENKILVLDSLATKVIYKSSPCLTQYPCDQFQINALRLLRSGEIVAATTQGVFTFAARNNSVNVTFDTGGLVPVDINETNDSIVWVGTNNYGMFQMKKNKSGQFQVVQIFFDGFDIKSIHPDYTDHQLLWLATDKGLIEFDRVSKKMNSFSEKDGMINSYVYGVLEDAYGYLWCSTNGGISRFDKKNKIFKNYISRDGLQSNEFNSGAYHVGSSGLLYFGGIKGLNWFDPAQIAKKQPTPSTEITEFFAGAELIRDSVLRTKRVTLPYFKNDLAIRFSVFDFSLPQSNKVEYQLVGWDEKPLTSYNPSIEYNNLLPGEYELKFRGSNNISSWSGEGNLVIVILDPYWKRWWFYLIIATVVATFIAVITWFISTQRYKVKIANLEKLNALEQERRRISMEMHDDVGANLTQITLISEAAKHLREKGDALEQIAQTSRQVVHSMSEIIWSLNPANQSFDQLMAHLRDQLHNLLESSGIEYRINLPDHVELVLGSEFNRNIILIVKEAVNNSIKHARATRIDVDGILVQNKLDIKVLDDGVGFTESLCITGNGMHNMKNRIKSMNGYFRIHSQKERGTTIHFQFLLPVLK